MRWLMSALSLAYEETDDRTFVRLRGTALLLTVAATTAFVVNLILLTATDRLAECLGLGRTGELVVNIARWPLLGALVAAGLAVLHRYGPDRDPARWRWVTWGSMIAVAASAGFPVYSSISGSFDKTYGSFAGVVVLMLWLMVTVFAILLGAEINAEMEHQTARDTTIGREQPLGRRGATVADEVAPAPSDHGRKRSEREPPESRAGVPGWAPTRRRAGVDVRNQASG